MANITPSSAQSSESAANKKRIPCPLCGSDHYEEVSACSVCAFDFSSLSEEKEAEATQKCSRCASKMPAMAEACQVCGLASSLRLPRPHTAELLIDAQASGSYPSGLSLSNAQSKSDSKATSVPISSLESAFRVEFSNASGNQQSKGSAVSRRVVVVQSDGSIGRTINLGREPFVIGRDECCDLCFSEDPFVDPRHALLVCNTEGAILVDLASKNGVYRRIDQSVILNSGDHFLVGQQLFRYDAIADLVSENSRIGREVRTFGSVCENGWGRLSRMIGEIWLEACLLTAEEFYIGRDHGDIRFGSDVFMSRRHVCLKRISQGPSLRDLGSANGTYLRIGESTQIQVGDYFRVGDEVLQLRND